MGIIYSLLFYFTDVNFYFLYFLRRNFVLSSSWNKICYKKLSQYMSEWKFCTGEDEEISNPEMEEIDSEEVSGHSSTKYPIKYLK